MCRRSLATSSTVALGPSMTAAGSPGMRWIIRKMTVSTTRRTGITAINRRARNCDMPDARPLPALLLLQPDVPEERPHHAGRALDGRSHDAQTEDVAVPDDGHPVVEDLVQLLPDGVPLLEVGLPP